MNMLQDLAYEGSPQGKHDETLYCTIFFSYLERKTQNLGGVSCYVVTPAGKYDHEKALILLTDIFSLTLTNNLVRVLLSNAQFGSC